MFDIAIIGAGPAGLFAIFQAGMMGLKCAVIDTLDVIGGQCSALYPEKPIYDIPGYPKIFAQDLIDKLNAQAKPFNPEFFLSQQAKNIEKNANGFVITTSTNNKINASTIIIAAGGGAFGPNRPAIDNIVEFENKSVFYSVNKRERFEGKKIVIAGGGDSAIDWCLSLSEIAAKIYLVHRRNKFKATPESMSQIYEKVNAGKIELVIPYQLHNIHGANGNLSAVEVIDLDNNTKMLDADFLLPFFGLSMNIGPIAEWGLDLEDKHIQVDPSTMQTNIKGIFAVGDIIKYPGKLKLILTGFAEAALACHQAYSMINGGAEVHFEYSTTKGIPQL